MIFFFRRNTVTLDCFSADQGAYCFSKPDHAENFKPSWWKQLPATTPSSSPLVDFSTMKLCAGFRDLYSAGFMIPAWSDINIQIGKQGTDKLGLHWVVAYPAYGMEITDHPPEQHGKAFDRDELAHVKIGPPWRFRTKEDMNWVWLQPAWHSAESFNYHVLPGVTNFKRQFSAAVNMFVKRNEVDRVLKIQYRQPLAHLVPLTEKKLELKYHLVDKKEFDEIRTRNVYFNGYYLKQQKGCPFRS